MIRLRRAAALAALLLPACATPLEEGDRLYQQGDRHGAIAVWRSIDSNDSRHPEAARRIADVEMELEKLTAGYVERARSLESEDRLAEAILDYRLALVLRPDDAETLAHVQLLARDLVSRKTALAEEYQREFEAGDLEQARELLVRLRTLDPFEPEYETEERQLLAARNAEWQRRQARYRARLSGEVDGLVAAGLDAFREERLEAALDHWRRALLIDPGNERIQAYIARAERQLENLERLRARSPAPGAGSAP